MGSKHKDFRNLKRQKVDPGLESQSAALGHLNLEELVRLSGGQRMNGVVIPGEVRTDVGLETW